MRIFKLSARFALSMFVCLMAFTTTSTAAINPPVKVNWLNSMGCDLTGYPCVYLSDQANTIQFVLRIRFSHLVNDISAYPEMKFFYNIGNGQVVGYTNPGTNSMITSTTLEDGTPANEIAFTMNVSVNDLCANDNGFLYNIQYQFVDGSLEGYPMASYPDLFPPNIFVIHYAQTQNEVEILTKNICCFTYTFECSDLTFQFMSGTPNGEAETQNEMLSNGSKSSVRTSQVYPNPFQDVIQIDYHMEDYGAVTFICLDANGKEMARNTRQHESTGDYGYSFSTIDWPSGVYFIRVSKGEKVETMKILKLN